MFVEFTRGGQTAGSLEVTSKTYYPVPPGLNRGHMRPPPSSLSEPAFRGDCSSSRMRGLAGRQQIHSRALGRACPSPQTPPGASLGRAPGRPLPTAPDSGRAEGTVQSFLVSLSFSFRRLLPPFGQNSTPCPQQCPGTLGRPSQAQLPASFV